MRAAWHAQRRSLLRAGAAGLAALSPWAAAQAYPSRPVMIVTPYAPGGSLDIVARTLAQRLGAGMGQRFLVENKTGAGGNIGTEQVVRSTPDGYTLGVLPDSNSTINSHLFPALRFDPLTDLSPVAMLSNIVIALVVNDGVPARNVKELLAHAKSLPNGLGYGSSGTGTPNHLAGELLQQLTGAPLFHVPYKGGSPAVLDVVSNQIPCAFVTLAVAAPHVRSGRLRLLGVTQNRRASQFPDAPALGESIPGFDVTSWIGLFAPAGTPGDVVSRLNAEVRKAFDDAATTQALAAQSLDVALGSPAELKQRVQTESARWGALIKARGITAQ